jgi:hypothetical protein
VQHDGDGIVLAPRRQPRRASVMPLHDAARNCRMGVARRASSACSPLPNSSSITCTAQTVHHNALVCMQKGQGREGRGDAWTTTREPSSCCRASTAQATRATAR